MKNKRVFFSLAIILILILLVGAGGVYFARTPELKTVVYRKVYPSFCDTPVTYKLGRIDKEFNIDAGKFSTHIERAAETWNKAYGEKLFIFDPSSKLSVNLVFDERQKLTNEIHELSGKLSEAETGLKPNLAAHKNAVAAFEKKMSAFSEKVKYWNDRGGAPEQEYDKLIEEQQQLKVEAAELNARAEDLNQSTGNFNSQITSFNETISEFNTTLKERPEEGLFDGKKNTITVFFYVDDPELEHTLTHEFGHAIGMTHVKNPEAIMYAKTNQKITLAKEDVDELSKVCARTPVWEILRDRYF